MRKQGKEKKPLYPYIIEEYSGKPMKIVFENRKFYKRMSCRGKESAYTDESARKYILRMLYGSVNDLFKEMFSPCMYQLNKKSKPERKEIIY